MGRPLAVGTDSTDKRRWELIYPRCFFVEFDAADTVETILIDPSTPPSTDSVEDEPRFNMHLNTKSNHSENKFTCLLVDCGKGGGRRRRRGGRHSSGGRWRNTVADDSVKSELSASTSTRTNYPKMSLWITNQIETQEGKRSDSPLNPIPLINLPAETNRPLALPSFQWRRCVPSPNY